MSDVFTTTGAGVGTNLVTLAYDKLVEINLRQIPQFRAIADKKASSLTHNGSSIRFQLHNDIADTTMASALLDETVDPDSVSVPATTIIDITEQELGRVVISSRKLALMSLADVDPWIANAVSYNMAKTLNNGVASVLDAGANKVRESDGALSTSAAITTILGTDTIKSRDIRHTVTKMNASDVVPREGSMYMSFIHPEVSSDLRTETGPNSWRQPLEYQNVAPLVAGETGSWEGVRFVETSTMTSSQAGSGSGSAQIRVFNTYVLGRQALAEAVFLEPHIEFGKISDKLNRLRPVGWLGNLNWKLYRAAALYVVQTAASGRQTV